MNGAHFRILCLDGGGIRGLITAILLEKLQKRAGRPLHELFDLIAGTSTGSILACGLATGRTPADIRGLYIKHGREVFPARPRLLFNRLARLVRPRYGAEGLEKVLRQELGGDTTLGAAMVKTLVVAYDTRGRKPEVFKSWREDFQAIPMWQVCRASCAAPTYFPGFEISIPRNDPPETPLIDGGVVANNPSAAALAEARRLMSETEDESARIPLDRFVLASFGAGSNAPSYDLGQIGRWGLARGARPIFNILMDGSVVATNYIVSRLLEPGNHFRFPVKLEQNLIALDDASPANLEKLQHRAEKFFDAPDKSQELDGLVEKLVANRP